MKHNTIRTFIHSLLLKEFLENFGGEYIFHGTNKGKALSIQRDKFIKPFSTGESKPSISFTKDWDYANYYATSKGGNSNKTILRTRLNSNFELSSRIKDNSGYEYITFNPIPSSELEIYSFNDKSWHPLESWNVVFDEPL